MRLDHHDWTACLQKAINDNCLRSRRNNHIKRCIKLVQIQPKIEYQRFVIQLFTEDSIFVILIVSWTLVDFSRHLCLQVTRPQRESSLGNFLVKLRVLLLLFSWCFWYKNTRIFKKSNQRPTDQGYTSSACELTR